MQPLDALGDPAVSGGRVYRQTVYRAWCEAEPCADCGGQFPYWVIHADHLPGTVKVASPSEIARSGSLEQLTVELAKCVRVCANCHHDRTYRRLTNSEVLPTDDE